MKSTCLIFSIVFFIRYFLFHSISTKDNKGDAMFIMFENAFQICKTKLLKDTNVKLIIIHHTLVLE